MNSFWDVKLSLRHSQKPPLAVREQCCEDWTTSKPLGSSLSINPINELINGIVDSLWFHCSYFQSKVLEKGLSQKRNYMYYISRSRFNVNQSRLELLVMNRKQGVERHCCQSLTPEWMNYMCHITAQPGLISVSTTQFLWDQFPKGFVFDNLKTLI